MGRDEGAVVGRRIGSTYQQMSGVNYDHPGVVVLVVQRT